jgi:uncharacterized protein (TIGR02266 family)
MIARRRRPEPATPAPPEPLADRRSSPRSVVQVEVTIESQHNFYVGVSGDISEGGLFVATMAPRPIDSILVLGFRLPRERRAIEALGVVRWVRQPSPGSREVPGMGVRFVVLSPDAIHAIQAFVWSRLPIVWD